MLQKVTSLNTSLSLYFYKGLLILAGHIFKLLALNQDYWEFFKKNMHKSLSRTVLICKDKKAQSSHQKYKSQTGNNMVTKISPIFPHAMQVKIEKSGTKWK